MDLTHKDENTESTEERTIMMDSIKALHTGEVRNEDSSDDSRYESVPGGEESHSGDGEPAEDEVTEEEYQEYLNNVAQLSVYGTEIDSTYGDQLLTLSTCNNYTQDGRMFILAKRVQ
mgnify:FL=1